MSYTFSGLIVFIHVDVQDVSIQKDSIAWHPTEYFYPLSSTFLLMAVICVNFSPTQTNNVSECVVQCPLIKQAATNTGPTSQLKLGFVTTLSINYT